MSYAAKLVTIFFLLALPAWGRQRVQGWCEQGNRTITVGGATSSAATPVQRSFPSCTVTVYLTGTVTQPQLYANNTGTTKTNPFTAASTGYWFFYIDDGTYDIQFSGGGISPTFSFGAVSAMDPFFYAPSTNPARLISAKVGDIFSVKDYGAVGDASTNNLTTIQAALDGACSLSYAPRVYFPRGQYNIAGKLEPGCAMYMFGDGPEASIIYETTQSSLIRAIQTDSSLTMVDIAVNTAPLVSTNLGMTGVARGFDAIPTSVGQVFRFIRYRSVGFNFGMIISGKDNFNDIFEDLYVEDSYIRTYTALAAVSNAINVANGKRVWVVNSTLVGDDNGDHSVYTIAVREVRVLNNIMTNNANSAVKILTSGFGADADCPVTTDDYPAWIIHGNTFRDNILAASLYTYCSVTLPAIKFSGNTVTDSLNAYTPDYATVYIQASCQSVIQHVDSSGNTFTNLGLGAIVLLSSVQTLGGCADPMAEGTIEEFTSVNDSVTNFSTTAADTFPAINSTGGNLKRATVVNLHSNGGGGPINLGSFDFAHVYGMIVADAPVSNVYALQDIVNAEAGRTMLRHRMATAQTADVYQLRDSDGNLVGNIQANGNINFDSTPGVYAENGARAQDAHIVIGSFTLSSGTTTRTLTGAAVFTGGSNYRCTANLASGAIALSVSNVNATQFTISDGTGSSSSTGGFICVGN